MPIASTSPNSDSVLIENPAASIIANVPTIEIGTAASGMIDARHVWRNNTTTNTTISVASSSVVITSRMESRTNSVGSYTADQSIPCGKRVLSSFIFSRTPLESASALDPGAWNTAMATADLLSSSARREKLPAPSSMRATSRSRVTSPFEPVLTMMLPNSVSSASRPCAVTVSWYATGSGIGGAPTTPAATWRFCSRIACTTSPAERLCEATRFGSSHTRIA